MSYNTFTLSNGLRIIHAPNLSKVAYCGFAVDAGTRDEYEQEQGMAHFVEHLIFKGTEKRHAWHILNRMENVGGDLNAYTNKEETVIYSAFLAEHFPRAVELLADIVFHSTFPQHEIDKEVEVIIDEIQSYEDSPSELIFDGKTGTLETIYQPKCVGVYSTLLQNNQHGLFCARQYRFQEGNPDSRKSCKRYIAERNKPSAYRSLYLYSTDTDHQQRHPPGTCHDRQPGISCIR